MIAGELLTKVQGLGYKLNREGGNLRYRYIGAGDPPKEARTLLDEVRQYKAEVLDFLRLLEPSQDDHKERLFISPDEAQGRKIERAGGVAYLPSEVKALLALLAGMPKEVWKDSLGKIYEVKKIFPGSRIVRN